MKRILMLFALVALSPALRAQDLELPMPSPTGTVTQNVGVTTLTVNYSRPSVKGRKIFGELVPYNQLWRTGANSATSFETEHDIMVEGKALKAGKYAIFTIPGESEWTVIFNSNWRQGGTGNYKESEDLIRVKIKPERTQDMNETFTIGFDNLTDSGAVLELVWDHTRVPVRLSVDTRNLTMKNIETATGSVWRSYARGASYMMDNGNLTGAMDMINQSIALQPSYYNHLIKARIQAKQGNYAEAVATAERAQALGNEKPDEGYTTFWKGQIEQFLTENRPKAPAEKGKKKK